MALLERITRDEVSLVFRRWRRPTVQTGGSLMTPLGVVRIVDVSAVREAEISDADVVDAGYASRVAMLDGLGPRAGQLYRIAVEYAGADPRIALRQQVELSEVEIERIVERLRLLDTASPNGPWTVQVLTAIVEQPGVAARVLAEPLDCDKDSLKPRVRKLKNLGLTVSLETGYELSPRGRVVLNRLRGDHHLRGSAPR